GDAAFQGVFGNEMILQPPGTGLVPSFFIPLLHLGIAVICPRADFPPVFFPLQRCPIETSEVRIGGAGDGFLVTYGLVGRHQFVIRNVSEFLVPFREQVGRKYLLCWRDFAVHAATLLGSSSATGASDVILYCSAVSA